MWDSMGGQYIASIDDVRGANGSRTNAGCNGGECLERELARVGSMETEATRLLTEHPPTLLSLPEYGAEQDGSSLSARGGLTVDWFTRWSNESYWLGRKVAYANVRVRWIPPFSLCGAPAAGLWVIV
jgi:hypothetical protein